MLIDKEILKQIKQEQKELFKDSGLYKEFRRLKRRFKREIFADLFVVQDEEEGYPDNKFFTAEVTREWDDNIELIYMQGAKTLDSLLRELEDYLDKYE